MANKRHPKKLHDSEKINDWNKIKDVVYKFQKIVSIINY